MILISSAVMAQEVVHKMELINSESNETLTIEIIDLDREYLFKSSNQEGYPNVVVEDLFYVDRLQIFLENEWISPDDYVMLKRIHNGEKERIVEPGRKAEAERQAEIERQRVAEQQRIEKDKREKEAKRRNADALLGGFSDSNGKADGGEGDDNQAGDKGKVTGDPNASGYYGIGGDGSGGNYRLSNRSALNKPKPDYPCNEEGKVVVKITVDQSGKVIAAEPGAKGTTNSASCLLTEAKEAALKTKFNQDSKAPPKQIGAIIYNFSLSD